MPRTLSRKTRTIYFSLFLLLFVVVIPVLLLYSTGYSIDEAFNLSGRGGVYVYVEQEGAQVYIGNELKEETGLFNHEVLEKNLRPGTYLVLVSHADYWPWAKFVDVKSGEVSVRAPLLVPKVVPFTEIVKSTSTRLLAGDAYATAKALFASSTTSSGLTSKNIRLWVENNNIHAKWLGPEDVRPYYFCIDGAKQCPEDIVIYQGGTSQVRAIDFYPGRDDALLLTIDNSIFATEIDPITYRNSYPIYRGKKPEVRISRGVVYIKDGEYIVSTEF